MGNIFSFWLAGFVTACWLWMRVKFPCTKSWRMLVWPQFRMTSNVGWCCIMCLLMRPRVWQTSHAQTVSGNFGNDILDRLRPTCGWHGMWSPTRLLSCRDGFRIRLACSLTKSMFPRNESSFRCHGRCLLPWSRLDGSVKPLEPTWKDACFIGSKEFLTKTVDNCNGAPMRNCFYTGFWMGSIREWWRMGNAGLIVLLLWFIPQVGTSFGFGRNGSDWCYKSSWRRVASRSLEQTSDLPVSFFTYISDISLHRCGRMLTKRWKIGSEGAWTVLWSECRTWTRWCQVSFVWERPDCETTQPDRSSCGREIFFLFLRNIN